MLLTCYCDWLCLAASFWDSPTDELLCCVVQVMESEEFMLLPANQLIDIISSDELNVRSEEQVFNAVMAWVKYSIQERRPQLPQVRIHFGISLLCYFCCC